MAIQFIQAASNAVGTASATSVATAFLPAAATNGDILIMAIATVPPISITSVPAGWSFVVEGSCGITFAGLHVSIYSKQASSEPASYSSPLTGSDLYTTNIVAVRGQNGSSSAIEVTATAFSSSGNAVGIPSITTTKPNDMWLAYAFQYDSATAPAGWDLPVNFISGAKVTSTHAAMCVGYQVLSVSGATGTAIISASAAAAFNPWVSFSIAILESAGAAGGVFLRLGAMLGVGT